MPVQKPLAPFRRLPQDVIREIFIACLDPVINPTMSKKEAPTLLTQISSGLRQIALTTPELWAAIHIPILGSVSIESSKIAQIVMDRRADGVKEWLLRRSGSLPLRISIRRGYESARIGPSQFTPPILIRNDIIDVVLSCHLRWRDVFFAMSYKSLLPFMKLQQEDVPLLHSFHYSTGTDIYDESLDFWKMCKFLAGPKLRRFCANSWRPPLTLLSFPIKWKNLTHLEFSMGTQGQTGDTLTTENVLRQCVTLCLISLKLAVHSDGLHTVNMDDIELTALEILNIQEFGQVSNFPGILAVILAPALKTLVYNVDGTVDTNSGNLVTMLKRTPNLKQLILGFCESHDFLLELVQHCPLLSYFQLSGRGYFPPTSFELFISAFILSDDCLCPHVDHFRCSLPIVISPESCRNIINRKKGSIPHLKRWKVLDLCITYEACKEEDYAKLRSEILADGWEAIQGIRLIPTRLIPSKITDEIGHQVYSDRRGALWPTKYMWPPRDMWPLEG